MDHDMKIREARKEDCKQIGKLIQELANFEKMPSGPKIDYTVLERDGFDKNPPLFKAIVADMNGKIVGHAIYYYTYCSWEGRSMFLDDFYIVPEHRKIGLGSKMFDTVAKIAANEKCARLEFSVLDWNPAQEMYKRKGAIDMTAAEAWHQYRLTSDALKKYANSS